MDFGYVRCEIQPKAYPPETFWSLEWQSLIHPQAQPTAYSTASCSPLYLRNRMSHHIGNTFLHNHNQSSSTIATTTIIPANGFQLPLATEGLTKTRYQDRETPKNAFFVKQAPDRAYRASSPPLPLTATTFQHILPTAHSKNPHTS